MSKRVASKYKINRRLGVNLWGRPKSPVNKREYGPGQHGQRRRKPSDFGTQLAAKQKLKGYYGNIGEKQFRRYYQEAVRRRGDTGENLIELLERRLDAVVYRAKFVPTVFAARQFVNHGHVKVNGKKVNVKVKFGREAHTEVTTTALARMLGLHQDPMQARERVRVHLGDTTYEEFRAQWRRKYETFALDFATYVVGRGGEPGAAAVSLSYIASGHGHTRVFVRAPRRSLPARPRVET